MPVPKIEEISYWLATRENLSVCEALQGEHSTDIAIIGGGFTGLWTAYFIKKLDPKAKVTLLEQKIIAYGASGRNGGMVIPNIGHPSYSLAHFGLTETRELGRLGQKNFEEFAQFTSDCDFEKTGQLIPALVPYHLELFDEEISAAKKIGLDDSRLLSAEETRNEVNSLLYIGGLSTTHGGIVNPVKVAQKLKKILLESNVSIYENTPVSEKPKKAMIKTPSGIVSAKRIVLATDAFGHHLFPELLWKYVPVYDYIIVSEPLSATQKQLIGWGNRQAVCDARTFFNYYRLTHDNRILWGTSEARYYSGNEVKPSHDYSERYRAEMLDNFAKHFPYLKDLKFPYSWGGPIASTTRLSACFGSLDQGNVIYALGYTGEGVACSRFAGEVVAHMALDKHSPLLDLQFIKTSPLPHLPEPLRTFAINAVTKALRKTDAGDRPGLLLKTLDKIGISFSS